MVGPNEQRVTYPQFLRGPHEELLFTYRDGGSGNGDQIYNIYDPAGSNWRRLIDGPLADGEGERNAYFDRPRRDAAGVFHLCWIWRETPDCATNHDICYARSHDLVHWQTAAGKPLALPITLRTADCVDPVPAGGGAINGNVHVGFDTQNRPVVSYLKYDSRGRTQAWNARWEDGRWNSRQVSDWDYRWEFGGGGTISFEVTVGPVENGPDGRLLQSFSHPRAGSRQWVLDPDRLTPVGLMTPPARVPERFNRPESSAPGMHVRWASDSGESGRPGSCYLLRWETRGPNRDRPHDGPIPAPTMLRLLELPRLDEGRASRPAS
jgi:hypothetical protein